MKIGAGSQNITGSTVTGIAHSISSGSSKGTTNTSTDTLSTSSESQSKTGTEGVDDLLGGLNENYGDKSGPPGQQGKGGVKNEEAQRQISDNQKSGDKALTGAKANQNKMSSLQQQLNTIRGGPKAGPEGETAAQANRVVEDRPRDSTVPKPELPKPRRNTDPTFDRQQELPTPSKGKTKSRIEVAAGEPGKESLRSELTSQEEQAESQASGLQEGERFKQDLERSRGENTKLEQESSRAKEKQSHQLQKDEQKIAKDTQVAEQAGAKLEEAKVRVGQDQQQVQQDQTVVEADQQNLNQANTSLQHANTENQEARRMVSEAGKSLQKAQELKPGNGGPNQAGKGGGGKGKGQGAASQGKGNGHGVVWKKTVASAQDFKRKASVRHQTSTRRRQSATTNVNAAKAKLQEDKRGLAKSRSFLAQSVQNRNIRSKDSQVARNNLSGSQKGKETTKSALHSLLRQRDFIEQQKTLLGETGRTLVQNIGKLDENKRKIASNVAKLQTELEASPVTRTVALQELDSSGDKGRRFASSSRGLQSALASLVPGTRQV